MHQYLIFALNFKSMYVYVTRFKDCIVQQKIIWRNRAREADSHLYSRKIYIAKIGRFWNISSVK